MSGSRPGWPRSNQLTTILLIVAGVVLVVGALTSNLARPTTERTEEHSIGISQAKVNLDVTTFNGAITLNPVESDTMVIKVILRGPENQLEETKVDFGSQDQQNTRLVWLHASFQGSTSGGTPSASLEIQAPRHKDYSIKIKTSNGAITLNDLEGRELEIHTSNGQISLTSLQFDHIDCATSNGRIDASIVCEESVLSTSNGQISLTVNGNGEYKATTSNGQISVSIPFKTEVKIDAATSNANVNWQGPTLTIEHSAQTLLLGQTSGYNQTAPHVDLILRTSNGAISVLAES